MSDRDRYGRAQDDEGDRQGGAPQGMSPPDYPKWFVIRVTDHDHMRFGGRVKYEQIHGGYVEAPGPGEAIIQAIGNDGAHGGEYRAYPVEGSAILVMELTVTAVESDGKATPESKARESLGPQGDRPRYR